MDKKKKKVAVITSQFSIVVKSMEKGLMDQGYEVVLIKVEIDAVKEQLASADVFVIYLQDSILSEMEIVKRLFLICDTFRDNARSPILIGNYNNKESFYGMVPALKSLVWMDRPVDMSLLMIEIEKEAKTLTKERGKRLILIIDDDPMYAKTVSEWIAYFYQTEIVSDGMMAISWLANNKPDLILLDYEMPVLDGPKVLEMLRMHSETSSIPVMFLTGIGTRESIARVMDLKPQGYVLKSTNRDQLLKTLKDFFDKQQLKNR